MSCCPLVFLSNGTGTGTLKGNTPYMMIYAGHETGRQNKLTKGLSRPLTMNLVKREIRTMQL